MSSPRSAPAPSEHDDSLTIVVQRDAFLVWSWEVHGWLTGRPWWASPRAEGSALTERGAWRCARRVVRDLRAAETTRKERRA